MRCSRCEKPLSDEERDPLNPNTYICNRCNTMTAG